MSGSQYDSADIPIGVQAMVWELFGIDPLISGSRRQDAQGKRSQNPESGTNNVNGHQPQWGAVLTEGESSPFTNILAKYSW